MVSLPVSLCGTEQPNFSGAPQLANTDDLITEGTLADSGIAMCWTRPSDHQPPPQTPTSLSTFPLAPPQHLKPAALCLSAVEFSLLHRLPQLFLNNFDFVPGNFCFDTCLVGMIIIWKFIFCQDAPFLFLWLKKFRFFIPALLGVSGLLIFLLQTSDIWDQKKTREFTAVIPQLLWSLVVRLVFSLHLSGSFGAGRGFAYIYCRVFSST